MSGNSTPLTSPTKKAYSPFSLFYSRAKIMIEASKAGDLEKIAELCKDV